MGYSVRIKRAITILSLFISSSCRHSINAMKIGILSPTIPTVSFALVLMHLHLDLHLLGTGYGVLGPNTLDTYMQTTVVTIYGQLGNDNSNFQIIVCVQFLPLPLPFLRNANGNFASDSNYWYIHRCIWHIWSTTWNRTHTPYPIAIGSGSSWPELKCNTSESIHAIAISIQKLPAISNSHCCLSSVLFLAAITAAATGKLFQAVKSFLRYSTADFPLQYGCIVVAIAGNWLLES